VGLPQGTPLVAPLAGTITDRENPGGFGHYQTIVPDASPSNTFILGHESLWKVKSGHVAAGTVVGLSGSTGNSTGPHLHFEEDRGGPPYAAGNDINPSTALTNGAPAVISTASATASDPCAGKTGFDAAWCQITQFPNSVKLDPVGEFFAGLNSIFSKDHLFRFALISTGIILVLIGLAVLARVPERLPGALQGVAAMTPEGAAAESIVAPTALASS